VREEVEKLLALSEADRLREEDPFTGIWTDVADTRIVADSSRFQVDLNRPLEKAVYIKPEDAWGLQVWKDEPSRVLIDRSLKEYDEFYATIHDVLSRLIVRFNKVVVLDLHTYNHRRGGPGEAPAEPKDNPEINIGTGSMDRQRWAPVVERFISDMTRYDFFGRQLDVRENVKFRGGQLSRWVHQAFPNSVCVLAVEVKKFFMDEWTGIVDPGIFSAIHKALASTVPGILEEIGRKTYWIKYG
jgi:hypothetical protein